VTNAYGQEPDSPEKIDYLIVTRDMFVGSLQPLVNKKTSQGLKVELKTLEWLMDPANDISGRDTQEKIRNYIKDKYQNNDLKWVLLAGDADGADDPVTDPTINPANIDKPWEIPIRYIYFPNKEGAGRYYYVPAEYYYAGLDGNWDGNNDGTYSASEINLTPRVYVGRLPAQTTEEMANMVNKIVNYVPPSDPRFLLVGARMEADPNSGDHSADCEYLASNYIPNAVSITRLYSKNNNLNKGNMLDQINNGNNAFVKTTGHGNSDSVSAEGVAYFSASSDISNINNARPLLWYSQACLNAYYDRRQNDFSMGEKLIKKSTGGAIAFIGCMREAADGPKNGDYSAVKGNLFWKYFFSGTYKPGDSFYKANIEWMQKWDITTDPALKYILLSFALLGDPELSIIKDVAPPSITIDHVASPTKGPITLSCTVSDNVSPKEKIAVTGNKSPYTAEGQHSVTLTAKDEAGNTAAATTSFVVVEKATQNVQFIDVSLPPPKGLKTYTIPNPIKSGSALRFKFNVPSTAKTVAVKVFNIAGMEVKTLNTEDVSTYAQDNADAMVAWDGKVNGASLAPGVYFFQVAFDNGAPLTGAFTVIK